MPTEEKENKQKTELKSLVFTYVSKVIEAKLDHIDNLSDKMRQASNNLKKSKEWKEKIDVAVKEDLEFLESIVDKIFSIEKRVKIFIENEEN